MDKIQARVKVKSHLKRRGKDCDFHVTPQFVLFWWHLLNKAVFDGKLTPPKRIEIKNFRDCFGWCKSYVRNRRVAIGVSRDFDDRKQFLTVLAHEMVHQWEYENVGRMSHGNNFYQWGGRLYRCTGLLLSEFIEL